MKFNIWVLFEKSVEKMHISLKCNKNNGYLTWIPVYFLAISRSFRLRMKTISDKSCRGNQKTHFVFSNFKKKSYPLWDKVEEFCRAGRPQMTIWRMRIACWIPKATNTHSEYVMLLIFHCNNGYTNAPQYCVILTISVVFIIVPFIAFLHGCSDPHILWTINE